MTGSAKEVTVTYYSYCKLPNIPYH